MRLSHMLAVSGASLLFGFALGAAQGAPSAQAPAGTHNLLSATHSDTLVGTSARGDLLVADATSRWTRLARCTTGFFVGAVGSSDTACTNDGARLTNLNATSLTLGTVPDERLSGQVVKYDVQDPTFNPGTLTKGTDTTWTFKTGTDNAVATLMVSSEGKDEGATPRGFAQLVVNAQDEVRTATGVAVGNNMSGHLRVMSRTFNNGVCAGTMCPDMTELYSDNDLRLTAAGTGRVSLVRNNAPHFVLDSDGLLKTFAYLFGIGPNGEQAFQLGSLGMDIGGDGGSLYDPPRFPPNDAMSNRRWVDGSLRVGARIGVGACDVISSPFGRPVELGETKDQAGLCVQPLGTTNIGAHITAPLHNMAAEGIGLRVDTRGTNNIARNIGISVTGGNGNQNAGEGGETALRILPLTTTGTDYGILVDAQGGVEFPLAVRVGGLDRFLVCGGGGIVAGLDCGKALGAGTINLAGDVYKNGVAYGNPDYVFEHFYTGQILKFASHPGASTYTGLKSVSALKAFTESRQQLPRMAEARGVFERQDALLESLEEAYLYIFQLQQRIDEQHARITALEKKRP